MSAATCRKPSLRARRDHCTSSPYPGEKRSSKSPTTDSAARRRYMRCPTAVGSSGCHGVNSRMRTAAASSRPSPSISGFPRPGIGTVRMPAFDPNADAEATSVDDSAASRRPSNQPGVTRTSELHTMTSASPAAANARLHVPTKPWFTLSRTVIRLRCDAEMRSPHASRSVSPGCASSTSRIGMSAGVVDSRLSRSRRTQSKAPNVGTTITVSAAGSGGICSSPRLDTDAPFVSQRLSTLAAGRRPTTTSIRRGPAADNVTGRTSHLPLIGVDIAVFAEYYAFL
ncbi:unannotated protein [freshwater metagenome]|uniref:Unannotated protein n=1 Tax=freshwater metagenome TaxID=449393 RepID=A0A6J7KTD3_9ZZZZ